MSNIYIYKNNKQLGPFDEVQIAESMRSGDFATDDLAWHEGLTEWVQLGELLKKNQTKPPVPTIRVSENSNLVQRNQNQGLITGGWICFALGLAFMLISMWAIFIYAPLLLASFILSIISIVKKKSNENIALLLCTVIIPSSLFAFHLQSEASYLNDKTRRSRAEAEIAAISSALESYKADHGSYPIGINIAPANANEFLRAALAPSNGRVYFEFSKNMGTNTNLMEGNQTIIDPYGEGYGYQCPGDATRSGTNFYDLWSRSGSKDTNKWIKNW
jgi:hypothetical protein